tara:strand:- start:1951 stop:3141 length:1191 start_codon:yes stop_codon:yes gene_type:complete
MSENLKNIEATTDQNTAVAENANPNADLPKKNAVASEPTHLSNGAEDLGAAVVKNTDSNPDASKSTKEVSGQAPQKSEGAPEAMPKLAGHNTKLESTETKADDKETVKEGEMPAGLKKYLDKKDDKEADTKKEEVEAKKDDEKTETKEKDIDVKEHVDALVAGNADLSEEFKDKAATIFETAIKSKVKEIAEEMETDYNKRFEEETSTAKAELVEKVDSYLSYVVEEWMKENELALERGIKGEIAEDFISGLKKLFEDHYINVPDEKYNVLEDQASKIETLEKKLNESIEKNVELSKIGNKYKAAEILDEASKDLTDTAKEKFNKLAEEVDYSTESDYREKVKTIKESYFKSKDVSGDGIDEVAAGEGNSNEDLSNAMAAYSAAISQTKDIKLSNK